MTENLVEVRGLSKAYAGALAVDDADFSVAPGEIVGLLGKNGAGKSTLIKILAGVETADEGDIRFGGEAVTLARHSAPDARAAGLAVMFQELEIYPDMTVAENVAIGTPFPRRRGLFVDRTELERRVQEVVTTLDPHLRASTPIGDLSPAEQRTVMIGRALFQGARLLVLDEPTTSLTDPEIRQLHALLRRLAATGHGIVYVSHRLDEVIAVTDRCVVMRDGRVVSTQTTATSDVESLIAAISGRANVVTSAARRSRGRQRARTGSVLGVSDVSTRDRLRDVAFSAYGGEILGIAGLVGAGRTELLRSIFGADARSAGTITLDGRQLAITSPRDAIRSGILLLPEDRRHEGLVDVFCVRENVTLPSLSRFRRRFTPVLDRARERRTTAGIVSDLRIKVDGPEQVVSTLSGGNQQKVVIAKWMVRRGQVMMFDEPTQGIDVDAKEEVYALMERLASEGAIVIFVSSEFPELVGACDRVLVMREGRLVRTLVGTDIDEDAITDACYARENSPTPSRTRTKESA